MKIDDGIESRRDDDDQELRATNVRIVFVEKQEIHTSRIATPRLNTAGFGSPKGLYESYSKHTPGGCSSTVKLIEEGDILSSQ